MSTLEIDKFRQMLLDERGRIAGAIEFLHEENPGSPEDESGEESYDNHPADVATITHDREVDDTLEDNAEGVLAAIDRALAKIEDGTYGSCDRCGKPIGAERLEALPYAELCIDCKRLSLR